MKKLSRILSYLSALLSGLTLVPLPHRRLSLVFWIPKMLLQGLTPLAAVMGGLGALIGLAHRDCKSTWAGLLGAAVAVRHVMQVTAPHDGFERAFGPDWRSPTAGPVLAPGPVRGRSHVGLRRVPQHRARLRLFDVVASRSSCHLRHRTVSGADGLRPRNSFQGHQRLLHLGEQAATLPRNGCLCPVRSPQRPTHCGRERRFAQSPGPGRCPPHRYSAPCRSAQKCEAHRRDRCPSRCPAPTAARPCQPPRRQPPLAHRLG